MKTIANFSALLILSIFLCGCPYDSPFAIDKEPQQDIDEDLIGSWAAFVQRPSYENEYTEQPVKIIFSKKTDKEYNVAITGYIDELKPYRVAEDDTIKGTAYLSVVDEHVFLNTHIFSKVYVAELKRTNNTLNILTLAEHFTNKHIKSSQDLRMAISFHYKTKPLPVYDDWFVAKNLQRVN